MDNALSVKKVREHNMSSSKWTTRDKITQYKGVVNLYKRDREVTEVDTAVAAKKQYKNLQSLRKAIDVDRRKLQNAAEGDKQHLRNILAERRELQLAYQNSDPKIVVESLHQLNFTRRKVLDRLKYHLKLKSRQLINLKLEEAVLQDRLKYERFDKIKEEEVAQIITGKVQDAILKKEAAVEIRQTYTKIIDLMKKDALYFDGILSTIQNDYWYQCRCILNATKQGQLATEYMNDRELEFTTLEKAVLQDIKVQKFDLDRMREQVESLQQDLKMLLRRDSDITTCILKVEEKEEFKIIRTDLQKIEAILQQLRNATLVTSFEKIYPSLQMQVTQKKRLNALVKKCERNRDIIMNKLNHAEVMSNMMQNTMVETTGEYKKRKKELLNIIQEHNQTKKICGRKQMIMCNLTAKVRISLKQLQQLCKPIKTSATQQKKKQDLYDPILYDEEIPEIEKEENDGRKIIAELTPKLTFLMANVTQQLDESNVDAAYKIYEILIKERSAELEPEEVISDDSLLEGYTTEASSLLTREDIKKQSAEIVAAHNKDEDLAFVPIKRKRRKFK